MPAERAGGVPGDGEVLPTALVEDIAGWSGWQGAPWGRLRYRIVDHTLERVCRTVSGRPLRVLDAGGGDGTDAIALARRGCRVTVLDTSPVLLERARANAAAAGVADRVRTVDADLEDLTALAALTGFRAGGSGSFDLVLCHDVLQHRPGGEARVRADIATLVSSVRPGGCVSLLASNPAGDVMAAVVRRHDLPGALHLLDASAAHDPVLDREVQRVSPELAEAALVEARCSVDFRFGIRCFTDLVDDDRRKAEPGFYADLERLELAACDREPYLRTARSWQIVGRRRG
ncbi:S-adenosylmethionine-dependent methyltransferase [Kineococcus xinjiangensis]|uniref:S-adenosylmethionine-dependent methyltransferase n=1 Tax=Kineococcus xinjiangensis TaxID=512762 RepID=A0A2S6IJ00_9ACTN|nr:methyltransferase domain-containing protein [Kineococcus xinjiangensis]PPK94171.1 S-adenosylmethionine-dependent methyltransferase [Kineococcus xinjiangensis]